MQTRTAVIVSESAMSRQALGKAFADFFTSVSVRQSLAELAPDGHWQRTVVVIDIVDLKEATRHLLRMSETYDLHRVVILVKSHHLMGDLVDILGKIGAIMPSSSTIEEICHVASAVREGVLFLPSAVLTDMASMQRQSSGPAAVASLTPREQTVLELLSRGFSNKYIAYKLGVSDSTVRVHVRAILKKLMLRNRTEAALAAVGHFGPARGERRAGAMVVEFNE